jgi:2Fe-2S ferredoxin
MATVRYIGVEATTEVEVTESVSVMKAALASNVRGIVGECGGDLSCATCHVFVAPEWFEQLDPVSDFEEEMLESTAEPSTEFSRLSCQIIVTDKLDGLTVTIPDSQY